MAKKTTIKKKVVAAVKKVVAKRKVVAKKEVVETTNTCQDCGGRGLKNAHSLCATCSGSGQV